MVNTSAELTLKQIVRDLILISAAFGRDDVSEVSAIAEDYALANADILDFYLNEVYEMSTEAVRSELHTKYTNILDYSGISSEFHEIARVPIWQAIQRRENSKEYWEVYKSLLPPDNLASNWRMLLRGIRYAEFLPHRQHTYELRMSPIDQHGLNNYIDPIPPVPVEKRLTQQWWTASHVTYSEYKQAVFEELREVGYDLIAEVLIPNKFRGIESANRVTTEKLSFLISIKIELDLATIELSKPSSRGALLNEVLARALEEFIELQSKFRAILNSLIDYGTPLWAATKNMTEEEFKRTHHWSRVQKIEEELTIFYEYYERITKTLSKITPRPELFLALRNNMPTEKNIKIEATNSIVNVESTLASVQQHIHVMRGVSADQKAELKSLVDDLREALAQVPEADSARSAKVATAADIYIEEATKDKPNRSLLEVVGDGLKSSANFLKDSVPSVIDIVGKIVEIVSSVTSP